MTLRNVTQYSGTGLRKRPLVGPNLFQSIETWWLQPSIHSLRRRSPFPALGSSWQPVKQFAVTKLRNVVSHDTGTRKQVEIEKKRIKQWWLTTDGGKQMRGI